MAFSILGFYPDQRAAGHRIHTYTTNDTIATVAAASYFDSLDKVLSAGDIVVVDADADGNRSAFELIVTAVSSGSVAVAQSLSEELLVTGAATPGVSSVELNHISTIIAATIADSKAHQGLFVVKDTSASGTAAHTLTLTVGTFDGTNNVATLNASNEALVVWFDSNGDGTIVENVGAVALS